MPSDIEQNAQAIDSTFSEVSDTSTDVEVEDKNSRTLRSSEERDSELRNQQWVPSRLLPTPNPIEGFDFRYVRVSSSGTVDNMNHSQALRDHWIPVMAEEVAEIGVVMSDRGSEQGNVVFGGLMLCKRPSWRGEHIQKIADQQSAAAIKGVDNNYLSDQNPSMAKFSNKSTKVTFGGG